MTHDKYSTWNKQIWHPQKTVPYKNSTPREKMPKSYLSRTEKVIFKRKLLNLLYDSESWSWDFKIEFFPLQRDIPVTLLCLIIGVGSISRVLLVPQETNNVVVRCHFCEMTFILVGIFMRSYFWKEECPFRNTLSIGAINVRWTDQAPLLDISACVTWPSHVQ